LIKVLRFSGIGIKIGKLHRQFHSDFPIKYNFANLLGVMYYRQL